MLQQAAHFRALPHLRYWGLSLFPKDTVGTLGRERQQVNGHTFDGTAVRHVDNRADVDMSEAVMPGFDIWLVLCVQNGWAVMGVSNMGRRQVNHVKVALARDSTTQDCCATVVHDLASMTVEVACIVPTAIQGRD